jgi:hypothetical protein
MKDIETTPNSKFRILIILSIVALLLCIPLIAMQFTNEVKWNLLDFIVAGGLLLGTGLIIEFVIKTVKAGILRNVLFMVILVVLFLIWAELAVGIFGSPFAGS